MSDFWLFAAVLLFAAAGFILWPLLRTSTKAQETSNRDETNLALFKERLLALQDELAQGRLNEALFAQQKAELERRLLEESQRGEVTSGVFQQRRVVSVAVFLLLLVVGLSLYFYQAFGGIADWQIREQFQELQGLDPKSSRFVQGRDALLGQVEARVQQRPDVDHYWMLLGQYHEQAGNYRKAMSAYQTLVTRYPDDSGLAGRLLQAQYLSAGRQVTPDIKQFAERILAKDPRQGAVLSLLGFDAFNQKNFPLAIQYWQRLLSGLQPGSADAMFITRAIEKAQQQLPADQQSVAGSSESVVSPEVKVAVEFADGVEIPKEGIVFVFAKAANGPPMPLAVKRLAPGALPATVVLDDSAAMTPAFKLSSVTEVVVSARWSRSGKVERAADDLLSENVSVALDSGNNEVRLVLKASN